MAYVERQNFQSSWMFIATWDKVSYYQDPVDSQYDHLRNSFQVVLLTDGSISFSIFNYGDITWTTGAQQGGNGSGLGGTEAQVGFNAGDGEKFYALEGSQAPDVINIDKRSNIGVPGRFIFRTDGAELTQPQCESFGKLSIYPLVGSMLGGTEVLIGGTCFNSTSIIKCRFDEKVVTGRVISSMTALCVTPTFFKTGRVLLNVSVNNGSTFDFSAVFTLENVEDTDPGVMTVATTSQSSLFTFGVEWDISRLMHVETVDVVVYGYREDTSNGLVFLENILILAENISYQAGSTNVTLSSINTTYEVGVFAVLEHQDEALPNNSFDGRAALWSEVHVLQWLRDQEPTPWCTQWLKDNEKDRVFIDAAPSCPCTLSVAILDFAMFRSDPSCFLGSNRADNCQLRPGAVHCVRAIQQSGLGGGQECCYASDGNISNAQISEAGGGFAHRYHHNGIRPHENATQVPFLSHFIADTLPWTYCCYLPGDVTDNTELSHECTQYITRRPSQMCNDYVPPQLALGNGDPHITTLDMKRYTFNGHGEFTLLQTVDESFVIQTRTAPYQDLNATVFVAVAAQCNNSDIIHVEIHEQRILDAYVRPQQGGEFERIDFEQAPSWNYEDVSVTGLDISSDGILVAFEGGSGLQLKAAEGALIIQVVPHSSLREQTRGLMGTWNGDVNDDYMTPEGNILSPNSTTEEVYFQFGLKWNVSEQNSLLYHPEGTTQADVVDLSYVPMFETTTNPTIDQNQVQDICNDDEFCNFDLQTTGSTSFAQSTANSFQEFQDAVESTNIVTCPTLDTPDFGNSIISRYTPGGEANYTCIPGYQISNDIKFTCQSDGSWSNDVTPDCIDIVKPLITCPGVTSNTTIPGRSVGMVSWMEPIVEENSDNFNVSLLESASNGGEFPIGVSNITYVVTDAAGLMDSCTFAVNVSDDEDPIIRCPDPIIVTTLPALNSTVVTWPRLDASDNSGTDLQIMPVGESRNGTNFTIGAVMLSYIVTDSSGNTDECSFWVNVTDTEKPVITCPVVPTSPTEESESYATVSWNEPSILDGTITDNSGSATPIFLGPGINGGNFEIGTNVLAYMVTDEAGNSNNCSFMIVVIDTERPRITCPNMTSNTTIPGGSVGMVAWMEPTVEENSGIFSVSLLEPASNGGEFPIGVSNITYVVIDAAGLMESCTFLVVVTDNEDPIIQCPESMHVATRPDLPTALVSWGDPTGSDNSGNVDIDQAGSFTSGGEFMIGVNTITYLATDGSGNSKNCSFAVNVTDNQDPMIHNCPSSITTVSRPGLNVTEVSWTSPKATDNSGPVEPIFLGPGTLGGNYSIGTVVLTYMVEDMSGNMDICTFSITVRDYNHVKVICPENIVMPTAPGKASAPVTWSAATNPIGWSNVIITFEGSMTSGGDFPIGETNLTYNAVDPDGLNDSCTFFIVVFDEEKPNITCPALIKVTTETNLSNARVSWPKPTAMDNSGRVTVSLIGPGSNGGIFNIGDTDVSYRAVDDAGNPSSCIVTVRVIDDELPVLTCPEDISTTTQTGSSRSDVVTWTEPKGRDNSGTVTVSQIGREQNGGNFNIGVTNISYQAVDDSGNNISCVFSILVEDDEPPTLECPESQSAFTQPGSDSTPVTWSEANATDNSGTVTVSLIGPGSNGGRFRIGTTNVTYLAMDDADNNDTCTFTITIEDDEAPVVNCPSKISSTTQPGSPSSGPITWEEPTATDNSGSATVSMVWTGTHTNGGNFGIGMTNITYQAVDGSENMHACSFIIQIQDDESPVLACPGPLSATAEQETGLATVSWMEPNATDNSGSVTVSLTGPGSNGGNFSIGMTNLTYHAVDDAGNMKSCVFSISVEDPSSCISDPCLNGGTCRDFSGYFICRCPPGFQGETCQQATVSCQSGSDICDATEQCVDSFCQCRPNFIRINGACIRHNRFRLTLTATSLLGTTLDYVDNFADPSSVEFQSIAEDFRGVILSIMSLINDLTVVRLEPGSVIFTFDGFVNTSTEASAVQSDLQNALGSGSTNDLILSPNTVPQISDFDECADATTNDCSPNAYCTNVVGSYECTCRASYSDESSAQIGSGRTCVFKRGLLIAIICSVVGFFLIVVFCGALCCWCSRRHYAIHAGQKPDVESHRPHRPHSNSRIRSKGPVFIHTNLSKPSGRNPAPRFIGDNIKMAHVHEGRRSASLHPSSNRKTSSHASRHHSYVPPRYSTDRSDNFIRPHVVTGSEPMVQQGKSGSVYQARFIP
ncbi:uncharacterized protein LOC105438079 [Strongylocentrotus purpuratus]|uniref:Uncharacterized protein n=1 Tax=Strongylocentrotus purpuratus TaxID=7668 RepID=A0A7M7PPR4_STRPU|nr:uncharacterized protein LOC105438079 [Strongylocentrotus purpuratus]